MLQSIYRWVLSLAVHRRALTALFIISFVESSVFPIPPDILVIPMILAARNRAMKIAAVCTLGSVLGGVAGYYVGHFLFEEIGRPILEIYNYGLKFEQFQLKYNEYGSWAVFVAGVTPFPYKVITILSGATGLDLSIFIIASILARGTRFFILAWLLWYFGDAIKGFVEKRLGLLFLLFCILLFGGFILAKFFL